MDHPKRTSRSSSPQPGSRHLGQQSAFNGSRAQRGARHGTALTTWALQRVYTVQITKCAAAISDNLPDARSRNEQTEQSIKGSQFDPAKFLETAAKGRRIVTHRKKEIIFSQGDAADAVIYIKKGNVKVCVISKDGKEAVVAILGADEFLGEGCLIGQPKRLATAMAMTECVTMRVEKPELMRVLQDEPAFSEMFLSHILARNARVEEDLVDQLFNSTEKRLARVLLLMANFGKEGRPEPIARKSVKKPSLR